MRSGVPWQPSLVTRGATASRWNRTQPIAVAHHWLATSTLYATTRAHHITEFERAIVHVGPRPGNGQPRTVGGMKVASLLKFYVFIQ